MFKKDCSRCTRPSFSSAENGEWICPACGYDLTALPVKPPVSFREISQTVDSTKKNTKIKNFLNSV